MFGLILPGRPLITPPDQLSEFQYTYTIPVQPSFSHIVLFLLPDTPIPSDAAAAIYIQLRPDADFTFLGALANDKPSAVFKVSAGGASGAGGGGTGGEGDVMMDDTAGTQNLGQDAVFTLGISLEPTWKVMQSLDELQNRKAQQQAARGAAGGSPVPTKVLAQRIIQNAFNFLASFAGNVGGPDGVEVVPLKSFEQWWKKFERRVEMDPGFLERGDGGA